MSGASTKTATTPLTLNGNLTINAGTFADGGNTITIKGNVTNNATYSGAGKIYLNGGSGSHTISGTPGIFGNIELDDTQNATWTSTGTATVNGTITITAGTLGFGSFSTSLSVNGTTTIASGATLSITNATGTKTFTGDVTNYGTWNNSGNAAVTIAGNLVHNGTTFTAGSGVYTFSGATKTISGTTTSISIPSMTVSGTLTNNITTLTVSTALSGAGTLTMGTSTTLNIGGTSGITGLNCTANTPNSVIYNSASGAQTVKGSLSYYDLTIDKSGQIGTLGTAAITVNNNLTVSNGTFADGAFQITGNALGILSVAAGATLQIGAGSATVTSFPISFTNANISLSATSTVIYNCTGAQTISSTPSSYGHLTLSSASTKTANGAINVSGNLTVNAGTFADGGNTITVNGNAVMTGTHSGAGKILLSGGSAAHNLSGGGTFNNLELNDALGATMTGNIIIGTTGTLTLTTGTFSVGAFTLTLNGPAIAGTPTNLSTTTSSLLTFGGSTAGVSIPSSISNLSALTVNNTNGISLNSSITLNANGTGLTIAAGAGKTILGNYDLILSSVSTISITTPAATNMIVADASVGSGQLKKIFPAATNTNFTFPIGDNSGSAEYTPVQFTNFNPAGATATIGVIVNDAIHSQISSNYSQTNYVSRYWTFTESGSFTSYSYSTLTATFINTASDIVGTVNSTNDQLNRWDGSNWYQLNSTVTSPTAATLQSFTNVSGALGGNDFAIRYNPPQTYTWLPTSGSASWVTPTNWSPSRFTACSTDILKFNSGGTSTATNIPSETENQILISNNTAVTFNSSGASTISINGATLTNNISIASGSTLTLGATVSLTYASTASQRGDISGTLNVNTSSTFNTSALGSTIVTVSSTGIVNQNGGTLTTSAATFVFGAGSNYYHAINGGTVPTAAWNATSTCNITGTTTTNPTGTSGTFGHFTWNNAGQTSATGTIAGALTIAGNLSVSAGTMHFNGFTVNVAGDVTNNGTITTTSASSTLNMNGSGVQTISGSGTWTTGTAGRLLNLTINNNSGANPAMNLNMNVAVQTALNLTAGILGGSGTLTIGIPATTVTTTRTAGSLSNVPAFNFTSGAYAITYNGGGAINTGNEVPLSSTPTNGALTVNTANTNVTLSADANIGTLTTSLASNTFNVNGFTLGLSGTPALSNTGTFTANASTSIVLLNGTAAQTFTAGGTITGALINQISSSNTNAASGAQMGGAITVNYLNVIASGYFNLNGQTLSVKNDVTNSGTIISTTASSALNMNGSVAQTISGGGSWTTGTAGRLLNLTVNNNSGSNPAVNLNVNVAVQTALNLTTGILGGSGTLTIGIPATAVTTTRGAGSLATVPTFNFTSGAYAITYNGTSQTYTVLNELPVSTTPTNGVLTVSLATDVVTLDKNANIGSLTTSIGGATFNVNGFSLGLSATGAVISNTGTFNASSAGSTVLLNGSGAQTLTIGGTFTSSTIPNLTINNSAGAALATSTTVSGVLYFQSGAFTVNTGITLTMNGTVSGSGTLTSGTSNAILIIGGSSTNMGTINLSGGAQTFQSITFNNSSTTNSTASPTVTFSGNITLAAASSALVMNGNASGGGVLAVSGNLTFSTSAATLTLTSGIVSMGNNTVTYTNNAATAGNLITAFNTGNAKSYFAFLGTSGGFILNEITAALNSGLTLNFPIGPAGVVNGFRPFTLTTNATTNIVVSETVKIGFTDHTGGTSYSPTNVPTVDAIPLNNTRANYIANVTLSGTIGSTGPNVTMTYQNADFNTAPSSATNVNFWRYISCWTVQAQTSNGTSGANTTITKTSVALTSAGTYPFNLAEVNNDPCPVNSWTWVGGTSTAWTTAANWLPTSVPNATTANVTINNSSATFQPTLTLSGSASTPTNVNNLTIGSGCTLTLSGSVATSPLIVNGAFDNSGTVTFSGTVTGLTLIGTVTNSGTVTPNSGSTVTYQGISQTVMPLTYYTLTTSAATNPILSSAGNITIKTAFNPGTANYSAGNTNGSTVIFDGASSFVYNGFPFYNITVNSGTLTLGATSPITIANNLTINTGATLADGTNLITGPGSAGTFSINGTGIFTMTNASTANNSTNRCSFPIFLNFSFSTTSTVNFNGAAAQDVYAVPSPGYGNLSTSTGALANAKTAAGAFTIAGTLTVVNATSAFYDGGNIVTANGNISNNGTINGTSGSPGSGEILLAGTSAQTISGTGTNFGNIEFNNSHASGVSFSGTAGSLLTVNGNIVVTGGLLNIGNFTTGLTVAGTTTDGGTLTINGAAGTKTFTGDVTVSGTGTFNSTAVAANISFSGNLSNSGTFNVSTGTGTYSFNGTSKSISGAGSCSFGAVTMGGITDINSASTVNLSGLFTINAALTNNGILNSTGTAAIAGASSITNASNASFTLANASIGPTLTATANPNLVTYTGTAAQTVKGTTYYNLTIDKSSNTATLGGATTVSGDLIINNGTLAETASFFLTGPGSGSGKTFTINNSGIYTNLNTAASPFPLFQTYTFSSTSTVNYNGDNTQNIEALTYGNLSMTAATSGRTKTAVASFTVAGNFTNASANVTFALGNNNTITFNGTITNSGTFSGTSGPTSSIQFTGGVSTTLPAITNGLLNLTVNRSGFTVTNGGNLTVAGTLILSAGVFSIGAFTLTLTGDISVASGTLTGGTTSSLTISGTSTNLTIPAITNNLQNLTMNRANGATLGAALSLSTTGVLTLTNGLLTTTSSNLLTINNTATGGISGGSASSYVNGPLTRSFPASLGSGSTYTFPIGKGSYNLFELVNPTTSVAGTVTAEVFDANSGGTAGFGLSALNTNRYWSASASSGFLNTTTVRLTEGTLGTANRVGQSSTLAGTYVTRGGTSPSPVLSSNVGTSLGYFVLGTAGVVTLSGVYTVGNSGHLLKVTDVAKALNTYAVSGNVIFELQSDYDGSTGETFPVTFNQFTNSGGPWNATIRPASGISSMLTTSGATASAPFIDLNGVDRLTFDGRPGGSGNMSNILWTITNTTNGTSYPNFRFISAATSDTLEYVKVLGSPANTTGTILLSTGGNNNDVIQYNYIGNFSSYQYNGILATSASGTNSDIKIMNNNIYNFQGLAGSYPASGVFTNAAICVTSNNSGNNWTISGNSIYATTIPAGSSFVAGISFNAGSTSSGNSISGNYIGGNAAQATGTMSYKGHRGYNDINPQDFTGIYVNSGGTVSVSANIIQNINLDNTTGSNAGSQTFCGINVDGTSTLATYNVLNNRIGDPTASHGNIHAGQYGTMLGILNSSKAISTICGNNVCNMTSDGAFPNGTYTYDGIIGIMTYTAGQIGDNTITNNIVNGLISANNYRNNLYLPIPAGGSSYNTSPIYNMIIIGGIVLNTSYSETHTHMISNNQVYELEINMTGGTNKAYIEGIVAMAGPYGTTTIQNNVIYNFYYPDGFGGSGDYGGLVGIDLPSGNGSSPGANYYVQNNMISLGLKPDGTTVKNVYIFGIWDDNSSNNTGWLKYYFYDNTVYIEGTNDNTGGNNLNSYGIARYFNWSSAQYEAFTIKNNIVVNNRTTTAGTGKNYGIYLLNYNSTVNVTCDYNLVYGTGTNFYYGSAGNNTTNVDYSTLAAWSATPAPTSGTGFDINGQSSDPLLVSPSGTSPDLHIGSSSPAINSGTNVGVSKDYDDNTRSSPDIGADEYSASYSMYSWASTCSQAYSPLPIELLNFSGILIEGNSHLFWSTASETNNDYFAVERSLDAHYFSNIGKVKGAGNSSSPNDYSFVDRELPSILNPQLSTILYYRLKQTDFDGRYIYSKTISLSYSEKENIFAEVFPNPVTESLNVEIRSYENLNCQIKLTDLLGREVWKDKFKIKKNGNYQFDLTGINQGIYFIIISAEGENSERKFLQKIVKE